MGISAGNAESTKYTFEEYLRNNSEKGTPGTGFDQESEHILRIDVDGSIWLRPGSAIAYRGEFSFERLPTLKGDSLEEMVLRELTPLARAVGKGRIYCAQRGYTLRILQLAGGEICINGGSILAFEDTLQFEMSVIGHGVSVAAGGLFIVRLSGNGKLAFAVHGDPLTMQVTPDTPVITDPHATLAWSGELEPELMTGLNWKSLFRHGGGEPFQLVFRGDGFVAVQPSEEPANWKPKKKLRSLIGL
jgi:uncharacterized protein (AIM24 family)